MVVITGKKLIKLLLAEGYEDLGRTRHGVKLRKYIDGRAHISIVKDTKEEIPPGTLSKILGPQQTDLGVTWLRGKLGQG